MDLSVTTLNEEATLAIVVTKAIAFQGKIKPVGYSA